MRRKGGAFGVGRAGVSGALGLALACAGLQATAQAQPPQAQAVPNLPTLPVPEGYLDATAPGSPAMEFLQLLQEEWRKRDFEPRILMAVWIGQAELDQYYTQGLNPLEGHYCFVCFLPSEQPEKELENLKAIIGPADPAVNAKPGWMAKAFKGGKPLMLGVLSSWDRGLVYGFLEPASGPRSTPGGRRFYLRLTAIVPCRGGGYQLNDSCMVEDEPGIRQAIARLEGMSRRIPAGR